MRRAARKRRTRQLAQVFEALQGDHSHPFAHEIYRRVHKKLPRISLATVYRNLHSLVEEGKIRTLLLDGQAARFDPETSEHDHFVCEKCGRPGLAASSTDRPDFAREAGLRRHDAQLDGPRDVSSLCRSTSDLQPPAPGGAKALARALCGRQQ